MKKLHVGKCWDFVNSVNLCHVKALTYLGLAKLFFSCINKGLSVLQKKIMLYVDGDRSGYKPLTIATPLSLWLRAIGVVSG